MGILFVPMFIAGLVMIVNELKGYKEYKTKVKYKVIPFVW